jgi:hypothetical protein
MLLSGIGFSFCQSAMSLPLTPAHSLDTTGPFLHHEWEHMQPLAQATIRSTKHGEAKILITRRLSHRHPLCNTASSGQMNFSPSLKRKARQLWFVLTLDAGNLEVSCIFCGSEILRYSMRTGHAADCTLDAVLVSVSMENRTPSNRRPTQHGLIVHVSSWETALPSRFRHQKQSLILIRLDGKLPVNALGSSRFVIYLMSAGLIIF